MNSDRPSSGVDPAEISARVTAGVRSHQIKIRMLTGAAFLFGLLAIATSIFFVSFYLVLYLPKQKQLLRDAESAARLARSDPAHGETSIQEAVKRIDRFLGAQIVMTHVVSMGTTMVALVVGILGLGTVVLLSVVVLSRRATLNQINVSLALLSDQLRQAQSQSRPPT